MLTAAKKETLSASSDPCVLFPLAARGVYPKTRIRGSREKMLHCFSATAPLSGNARRGWENSSGKSAPGSALDNNGNTLTKVVGSNTTSYAWDFENRLTSVTLPGSGGTVTFKYDPFGRRIYKSWASATSVYTYDGNDLIEETNSSGTPVARYSDGLNIDEPLAMLRSAATTYYQADGLGSITSLSNTAGALAQTYTFDSFGKQTGASGSLTNPFQFNARELDSETNLYFYRRRYYDPTAGRFTREDPLRFGAGDSNFYSYVSQNPVNYTDPSGKQKIYGNWCGPNWTGGLVESFNPAHVKNYKKPIDDLDTTCMVHDICYFNCRSQYACSGPERQKCFRTCDKLLLDEVPINPFASNYTPYGPLVYYGILLHVRPDPENNLSCGCYNVTRIM
jgi:RHS repeat-associated protein